MEKSLNHRGLAVVVAALARYELPVQQDTDWVFAKNDTIDLSIQLHMEDAEQVRYMLVHVHGGGQSATCVSALLRHLGLRAHDTATGELFDGYGLEEAL